MALDTTDARISDTTADDDVQALMAEWDDEPTQTDAIARMGVSQFSALVLHTTDTNN